MNIPFGKYGVKIMFECYEPWNVTLVFSLEEAIHKSLDGMDVEQAERQLLRIRELTTGPCILVSELETYIGNTKALMADAKGVE